MPGRKTILHETRRTDGDSWVDQQVWAEIFVVKLPIAAGGECAIL